MDKRLAVLLMAIGVLCLLGGFWSLQPVQQAQPVQPVRSAQAAQPAPPQPVRAAKEYSADSTVEVNLDVQDGWKDTGLELRDGDKLVIAADTNVKYTWASVEDIGNPSVPNVTNACGSQYWAGDQQDPALRDKALARRKYIGALLVKLGTEVEEYDCQAEAGNTIMYHGGTTTVSLGLNTDQGTSGRNGSIPVTLTRLRLR